MDLEERHQLDMPTRMQLVRSKARPWKSILALLVAIVLAIATELWRLGDLAGAGSVDDLARRTVTVSGAALFFIFGTVGAVGLSGKARSTLQPIVGQAHAGVVRYVLVLVGVFAMLAIALGIGGVQVQQLLVGGAVTAVVLGIAAQQSLANLFAGLVLLFARPFRVGDRVRFRAGALSGQIDGVVTDVSLTYVRLETDEGRVLLPNAQALAAAVVLLPDKPGDPAAGPAS